MARLQHSKTNFTGGEIAPRLLGRGDLGGEANGAGRLRILFQIMIPLAKASIAVIALFYLVAQWNSYFPAMIYLQHQEKWPLQLVLRRILIESQQTAASQGSAGGENRLLAESVKFGTIIVSIVPMLLAYPFIQKYFVGGIMVGAIKG